VVDVKVNVLDKPMDLTASDLTLTLAWTPEPEPYGALIDAAAADLAGAVFVGDWPWLTVLDAMSAAVPAALSTDFDEGRLSLAWDTATADHFALAGVDPRAKIAEWAALGLASESPLVEGRLTALADPPGQALLELDAFAGGAPDRAGIQAEHLVAWTTDGTDTVVMNGTLPWSPPRYAAHLAEVGAKAASPGVASVPDALAVAIGCDALAASLAGYGACDAACLEAACDDALAALWAEGVASAPGYGEIAVTAGGPALVDDVASLVSFSGAWVGNATSGELSAPVSGAASGELYDGPPN
jgi:hypothetical protein